MSNRREIRQEAFQEVRDWMRSCTRRELRTRLDEKIRELADPEHVCSDCGKMFETKAAWAGHRQKHIAEEQDPVTCETCGETFANRWAYIGHQQKHLSDGDPVACGICGQEFRNEADFNIHKQTHLGQRTDPVECGECGTECRNQRMLKVHKGRKHGGSEDHGPANDHILLSLTREQAQQFLDTADRLREALNADSKMRGVTVEEVLDRLETIADQHELWATEAFETGEEKERYSHESVADVVHDEVTRWRNRLEEVHSDEQ